MDTLTTVNKVTKLNNNKQLNTFSGEYISPDINSLREINIVLYIILTLITFGLFYLVWQYKQMKQCNILLGRSEHGILKWIFLSFITFGIYHFYHEYTFSKDILEIQEKYKSKVNSSEYPLICLIVSLFATPLVTDFIHQEELNNIIKLIKNQ